LAGVFGGQALDTHFAFSFPYLTLILTILAFAFAMYYMIYDLTKKK